MWQRSPNFHGHHCEEMTEELAHFMKFALATARDTELVICFQKSMVAIHDHTVSDAGSIHSSCDELVEFPIGAHELHGGYPSLGRYLPRETAAANSIFVFSRCLQNCILTIHDCATESYISFTAVATHGSFDLNPI